MQALRGCWAHLLRSPWQLPSGLPPGRHKQEIRRQHVAVHTSDLTSSHPDARLLCKSITAKAQAADTTRQAHCGGRLRGPWKQHTSETCAEIVGGVVSVASLLATASDAGGTCLEPLLMTGCDAGGVSVGELLMTGADADGT